MLRKVSSALVFFLSCLPLFSQTTSTTILGTVTDSTGASIAGAKVTVANVNTGIKREETTSAAGIERQGFKTETQTGIDLQINQGNAHVGSYENYSIRERSK